MAGERTEQATQHRRDKARKEGDILHSRELTAAAGTLAGVLALGALGRQSLPASWPWERRRAGNRPSWSPPWRPFAACRLR